MNDVEYKDHSGVRVLFLDIVGFTGRGKTAQVEAVKALSAAVLTTLESTKKTSTKTESSDGFYVASTGDGYVVSIYDPSSRHGLLLDVACEIQERLARLDQTVQVRYGLNSGPGVLVKAHGKVVNVLGSCINVAHRIMSLGDGQHILMSDSFKQELDIEEKDSRLVRYADVRIEKRKNSRAPIYNYSSGPIGNRRAPYRLLMGHLNIEHATEEILDIICERVLSVSRDIARRDRSVRHSAKKTQVTVSVLNVDREDGKIWVTPHRRCNGETVTAADLDFEYGREAMFKKLINSMPDGLGASYMFLGLPDGRRSAREHTRAVVDQGVSRELAKKFFDRRSRAFLFHPIFHTRSASVVGLLKVESSSPICNPTNDTKRIEYSKVLAECFGFDLMRVLGHCYQD